MLTDARRYSKWFWKNESIGVCMYLEVWWTRGKKCGGKSKLKLTGEDSGQVNGLACELPRISLHPRPSTNSIYQFFMPIIGALLESP